MALQDHAVLGQLSVGHCPLIDAQRAVVGTRLALAAPRNDANIDGAAVLAALAEVWPPLAAAKNASAVATGTVALNVAGEGLLRALLSAPASSPFAIEVPAFLVADCAPLLQAQHLAGAQLWVKGRGATELTSELRACFSKLVYELPAAPPTGRGSLGAVAIGASAIADVDAATRQGAVAVAGWPLADPTAAGSVRQKVAPELQVVLELINRVDAEESIERLEATLKSDPSLAFRLLRYMNSAAFGFSVEISSFRHALMMLGYPKLKRWLALLLVSASKDARLKPVMYAAVRRGLVMEELARSAGDAEIKSEMFICGVFSLLDRLLGQPFSELLPNVPVPERVRQALSEGQGPFMPYLELVRALENGAAYEVQEHADALMLASGEINRALLAALLAARQLD
jgi:c-di-GMP phosphodiesterase